MLLGNFSYTHLFFYKQSHFPVESQVPIRSVKNAAESSCEVAKVFYCVSVFGCVWLCVFLDRCSCGYESVLCSCVVLCVCV